MVTHEQLLTLTGVVDRDGVLWAVPGDGTPAFPITGPDASPDFRNLRNASLLMYRTIAEVETGMSALAEWLESVGGETAVEGVLRMQSAMNVTRRCAIDGIEKVARDRK